MRRWSACVGLVLLASACGTTETTVADQGEAEVLGVQIEREPDGVRTFEPTGEPELPATAAPGTPSPESAADPAPSESPSADPEPTASPATAPRPRPSMPPEPEPTAAPTATQAPDPASPAATSPPPPAEPQPTRLQSREGHSYVTWFAQEEPREDGNTVRTWAEISAAPPITRGEPSEPLRVTLREPDPGPDVATRREARCAGFLENDGDVAVLARGDLRVTVVVDGGPALDELVPIDVRVEPGERRDLLEVGGVVVDVAGHDQVTCAVTFAAR